MTDHFKVQISQTLLSIVKLLPSKSEGTLVGDLQKLRENQIAGSAWSANLRKKPTDGEVNIDTLTVILTFEIEEFDALVRGLNRAFPKRTIEEFMIEFERQRNALYSCSMRRITTMVPDAGTYPLIYSVHPSLKKLPFVKSVEVWFYRILPSLAALSFEFKLNETVSAQIAAVQSHPVLPVICLERIPLFGMKLRYFSSKRYDETSEAVRREFDNIASDCATWLRSLLGIADEQISAHQFNLSYSIKGTPTEAAERKRWLRDNRHWLHDYGITEPNDEYENDSGVVWSRTEFGRGVRGPTFITRSSSDDTVDEFVQLSSHAYSALNSILNQYQLDAESLRASGFSAFTRSDMSFAKSVQRAWELKNTRSRVVRMCKEWELNKRSVELHLESFGNFKGRLDVDDTNTLLTDS